MIDAGAGSAAPACRAGVVLTSALTVGARSSCQLVPPQLGVGFEAAIARRRTVKRSLASVNSHVLLERGSGIRSLAADQAGIFAVVYVHVLNQRFLTVESERTQLALPRTCAVTIRLPAWLERETCLQGLV